MMALYHEFFCFIIFYRSKRRPERGEARAIDKR